MSKSERVIQPHNKARVVRFSFAQGRRQEQTNAGSVKARLCAYVSRRREALWTLALKLPHRRTERGVFKFF